MEASLNMKRLLTVCLVLVLLGSALAYAEPLVKPGARGGGLR